jgi:hypothetical protein
MEDDRGRVRAGARTGRAAQSRAPSHPCSRRGSRELREDRAHAIAKASPSVVHLASEEVRNITGRVIQAGFRRIAVCDGWRRGAEVKRVADAETVGALQPGHDSQGAQEQRHGRH